MSESRRSERSIVIVGQTKAMAGASMCPGTNKLKPMRRESGGKQLLLLCSRSHRVLASRTHGIEFTPGTELRPPVSLSEEGACIPENTRDREFLYLGCVSFAIVSRRKEKRADRLPQDWVSRFSKLLLTQKLMNLEKGEAHKEKAYERQM